MYRKNYVSEQQKGIVEIDLCDDSSDESDSNKWMYSEKHDVPASKQFMAHKSRSKRIETTNGEARPPTPPPPIISFRSDSSRVKNRTQRVEKTTENKYPPHEQTYSMDCPPPPPIFSLDPDSSKDRDRTRVGQHLENVKFFSKPRLTIEQIDSMNSPPPPSISFDRNSSTYKDQPPTEERTFENRKSSRKERKRNKLSSGLNSPCTLEPNITQEPKSFILTIVDEGPNPQRLGTMNWRRVESALCMVYLDIMRENPGPPPKCRDVGLFLGCAKIVECADERSQKLYSLAISRLGEVWPGAKLTIVDRNQISTSAFRIRATALVPAEPSTYQQILERIQSSNPDLPTNNWIVVSVGAPSRLSNERNIIISFDIASLAVIQQRRGVINYGLRSIVLKINKRDLERMQRLKKNEQNILFEDAKCASKLSTSRERPWSELEAEEVDEIDDDAMSESDSEDDEGYDWFRTVESGA